MKKIIILGAKGNLGTALAGVFSDCNLNLCDGPEFNILNFSDLRQYLDQFEPDIVINAAAYNAVDKCETSAQELALAIKLNEDLPRELAAWCLQNQAILVHYSTDYVFDGGILKPEFNEEDLPKPLNKYGQTKFQGEQALVSLEGIGLKYYLIRSSKLFGVRGKSAFAKASFFDIMLDLASNKDKIQVVDEELSCFTYIPDLALATRSLLDETYQFGIYHLVNSQPATWYKAMLALKALANLKVEVEAVTSEALARPAVRSKFSILKNNKFPALRPYPEALKEYLESK